MSTTPIRPIIEMLIGDSWVDITGDCRVGSADSGGGLEITRGVPNEGATAEPTQFNFTLNNIDGKYSPLNPNGPYFGQLGRNQRVRLGLDRRVDSFTRTSGDDWGTLPAQPNPDGTTTPGEMWRYLSPPTFFDTTGTAATIIGSAGTKIATFSKPYGDVDIKARMRVSTRDTEFGLVARMKKYRYDDPAAATADFDDGIGGWVSIGGHTLNHDTSIKHAGAGSLRMTVVGSPATASAGTNFLQGSQMYGPVVPGDATHLRMWCRVSAALTVRCQIDWFREDLTSLGATFTDLALAANTWTSIVHTNTAVQDAYYARPVAILQGSPPTSTNMWIDQVEMQNTSTTGRYSTYIAPGAIDQIRIGKVWPGTFDLPAGSTTFFSDLPAQVIVNTWYWMRTQIAGQRIRTKFWLDGTEEPTAWNRTHYDDALTSQVDIGATGEVGFISKDGTALMSVDDLQVDQWRAHTEISQLPPRWDLSRSDRWVPIESRGILRRLGQGRKSLRSAVSLHLEGYTGSSFGWWPLESDTGDRAGNNIEGGNPATISGLTFSTPDFTGNAALPGVSGYADLEADTALFSGQVKPHVPVDGKQTFLWFMRIPNLLASEQNICTIYSSGTVRTWKFNVRADGGIHVIGIDNIGTSIVDQTATMWNGNPAFPTGCWIACTLYMKTVGGNVEWAFNHHRPGDDSFFTTNNVYAGSVGVFNLIQFRSNAVITAAGDLRITQVMHYRGDLPFVTSAFSQAAVAYDGETATTRHLRLCSDAQIPAAVVGDTFYSPTPMGPQAPDKLLVLLEEGALAEDGFLLEQRDDWGLDLVARVSLWNRRRHPLSIEAGHLSPPLEPEMDDQITRNDVTVNRPDGGFGRSIQTEGPLNVNPPETDLQGVGTYDEQVDINYGTDTLCQSAADWRRSKGTLLEPRYPAIRTDLTARAYQDDAALAAAVMSMDIGSVIDLHNPEADYLVREQQVQAYVDRIDDWYDWDITWTAVPADTRRVGVVNYTTRVDTESNKTTIAFVVNGTNNVLTCQNLGVGYPWVTLTEQPTAFPFEVEVAGVVLRVLATGTVLNKNPGAEIDTSGWSPTSANALIFRDRYDPQVGVGNFRVRATVAGTDGMVTAAADQFPVTVGASYHLSGWVSSDFTQTDFRFVVDWYTAASAFISTSANAAATPPNTAWNFVEATVTAPATAAFGRLRTRAVYAAPLQRVWYDDVRAIPVATTTPDPQTLTVDPVPVNGIYKTIPVGSPIRLIDHCRVGW